MAVEFKKSFVSQFKYNDLTPGTSWAEQFIRWARLDNYPDEDVKEFVKKLRAERMRSKAMELVRGVTVPD